MEHQETGKKKNSLIATQSSLKIDNNDGSSNSKCVVCKETIISKEIKRSTEKAKVCASLNDIWHFLEAFRANEGEAADGDDAEIDLSIIFGIPKRESTTFVTMPCICASCADKVHLLNKLIKSLKSTFKRLRNIIVKSDQLHCNPSEVSASVCLSALDTAVDRKRHSLIDGLQSLNSDNVITNQNVTPKLELEDDDLDNNDEKQQTDSMEYLTLENFLGEDTSSLKLEKEDTNSYISDTGDIDDQSWNGDEEIDDEMDGNDDDDRSKASEVEDDTANKRTTNYPDTIDFDAMVELTSPIFDTGYSRMSSSRDKSNLSGGTDNKTSGRKGPRLGALLTRSSRSKNKGNVKETATDPLSSTSASSCTPFLSQSLTGHSNDVARSSSAGKKGKRCVIPTESPENVVKVEENLIQGSERGDESNDDDDDDARLDDEQGDGDDSVLKKKKQQSDVVIHDHITVLEGEPPMYQCNVCQKKFKTKTHIKYHEFCQNGGDKPFKCEQCGQGFIVKSHYEYHLRMHTGERPHICPKCGKGFTQRGKLTRHIRAHTGEKPFVCEECHRGFANAQALRCHKMIHTGERPFACTYCNKRFTGMTNLKKHVLSHTGDRAFKCNLCEKSFTVKWNLNLHMKTHSSERPYPCDQCSRAFLYKKDLNRHLNLHSGELPFKCLICESAFARKDNLDRHIKRTHDNQPKEVAKKSRK